MANTWKDGLYIETGPWMTLFIAATNSNHYSHHHQQLYSHHLGSIQYLTRHLLVTSRKVSKTLYWVLELSNCSDIWQASRQQCCWVTCQISNNANILRPDVVLSRLCKNLRKDVSYRHKILNYPSGHFIIIWKLMMCHKWSTSSPIPGAFLTPNQLQAMWENSSTDREQNQRHIYMGELLTFYRHTE